jgi:hypothetical protein
MKRIRNYAAVTVIAALIGSGIPAMAAQHGENGYNRGGMRYEAADHRSDRDRNNNRWDSDRRGYDRRDYDRGSGYNRGYSYGYAEAPVYEPAPVYGGPVYDDGYYRRSHNGRTAAIIGGSAAAGALIGAAAGHGQGAVIGAVIGGIAGAAASAAANHHDRH